MPQTPYDLPGGDRVWVIDPSTAADSLGGMLERFRGGDSQPLVFGESGRPEAVVVCWDEWRRVQAALTETEGFDHLYDTARERSADTEAADYVALEDVAAELGWDLDAETGTSDLPRNPPAR